MFRKLILWLSESMGILASCLFIGILGKIIITGIFGDPVGFEEKIIWLILLVGSLLWLRIEAINISKIDIMMQLPESKNYIMINVDSNELYVRGSMLYID